jgi:hypothetical protein
VDSTWVNSCIGPSLPAGSLRYIGVRRAAGAGGGVFRETRASGAARPPADRRLPQMPIRSL